MELDTESSYTLLEEIRAIRKKYSDGNFESKAFEAEIAAQVSDVLNRGTEAAAVTTDPLARRAVQLLVKRDLVAISYDSLVEFMRTSKYREVASILQTLQDSYHNISDEWRVLLEDQEASWRGDLAVLQEELRSVESETSRQDERVRKLEQEKDALKGEKERLMKLVEALQGEKERMGEEMKNLSLMVGKGLKPTVNSARSKTPSNTRTSTSPGRPGANPEPPASGRSAASGTTPNRTRGTAPANGAPSPANGSLSARQQEEAAALNKMLTLKQLKDCIKELYESKLKSDAAARQGSKPRATMEEHLYAHYNTKLGIRSVILIHIERILKAIDKYGQEDFEVALFGKILANEVEEEFYYELQHLEKELKEQLKALLRLRFAEKPKEFVTAQLDVRIKGDIEEEEARTLVNNMQDTRERDLILRRVDEHQTAREKEKPRQNYSDPIEIERPTSLKFEDFMRIVILSHTDMHEHAIRAVTEAFRLVDKDRAGYLTPEQFAEFCRRISVEGDQEVSDEDVARLLDILDPYHVRRVTFSSCIYELAGDLQALSAGTEDL